MKKFLAVLLVVTLAITGVFAVDMSIGAELGFGQHIMMPKEGNENGKEMMVPVRVDLLLGLDNLPLAFRVDAGTNLFKLVPEGNNEVKDYLKVAPSISVAASVYYKYDVNNKLSLMAGLGLGYDRIDSKKLINVSKLMKDSGAPEEYVLMINGMDMPRDVLSMYIDTQVRYEVVDHVQLFGGFKFGGTVMDKITAKANAGGTSVKQSTDMNENLKSNIIWGLSVGAAYKF